MTKLLTNLNSIKKKKHLKQKDFKYYISFLVFLFFIGFTNLVIAQPGGLNVTNYELPNVGSVGAFSFSVCDDDPSNAWFTILWDTLSPTTNAHIDLIVPLGMNYVDGSLETLTGPAPLNVMSIDSITTRFEMGDIDVAFGSFRFRLNMNCDLIDYLNSGDNVTAKIKFKAVSDQGQQTNTTIPLNNLIGQPHLIANPTYPPENSNTSITNAEVSQNYTRTFKIEQTGINKAELNDLTICMDYGVDLSVNNQTISQIGNPNSPFNINLDPNNCIEINSSSFPQLNFPLEESDSLIWTEGISIEACDSLSTNANISWGCGGSVCRDNNFGMSIILVDNTPSLTLIDSEQTFAECIQDGSEIETTWELTGKAYDLSFRLKAGVLRTYIDLSSVMIDLGTGVYTPYVGAYNNEITTDACGGNEYVRFYTDPILTPLNDITDTLTVRLKYKIITCCISDLCEIATGNIMSANPELIVKNQCDILFTSNAVYSGAEMETTVSEFVPSFMEDGEVKQWKYFLDNIPRIAYFQGHGQLCMDFTLEAPLVYMPNSIAWSEGGGVDPIFPNPINENITINSTGTHVEVCFDQGDYHGDGSEITFDVSYSCDPIMCGGTVKTDMFIGFRMGNGNCIDNCMFSFKCDESFTALDASCCPNTCAGLYNLYFNMERNCFGYPDNDNDGCPDDNGIIDLDLVLEEKAMQGDELVFESAAVLKFGDPSVQLNYLYLDLKFPLPHNIGSTQNLIIFDQSANAYYDCDELNVFNSGDTLIRYYLRTDLINSCGTIPNDFIFEDGDSIKLDGSFVNIHNPGCISQQIYITADWFYDLQTMPIGGDHLSCNAFRNGTYMQVGYALDVKPLRQEPYGCNGAKFDYKTTFCIGGTTYQSQPFPHEIRSFKTPDKSGFLIPEGLVFDKMELTEIQFTHISGGTYVNDSEDVTVFTQIIDGYIVFDWDQYFGDCSNNFKPNGAYTFELEVSFEGICSAEPSKAHWFYQSEIDYCSPVLTDEIIRMDSFHSGELPINPPGLNVFTSQSLIYPVNEYASWDFSIRETEGREAYSSWMLMHSPSGGLVPSFLTHEGDTITSINGIYQLGSIAAGEILNYSLDVSYSACDYDSLLVLAGWSCGNYPISSQQVLLVGMDCPVDTLRLDMKALEGVLQQQTIVEPTNEIEPCSAFDYELEIKNVGNAELFSPFFELFIPYTSGLELVENTAFACYPCNTDNPNFIHSLNDASEITITPQGVKYIWDLENLIPGFDHLSPDGLLGEAQLIDSLQRVRLKFQVEANCNFIAGDYINFKTKAFTHCGAEVSSILQNSSPVLYNTVEPIYQSFINIDLPESIDGCVDGNSIVLDGFLVFFGQTDGNDTLILALPPALSFVESYFDPLHITNINPQVNTMISPVSGDFFDEMRWHIKGDLPYGTIIPFQIETTIIPEKIYCDDDNLYYIRTVRGTQFMCDGSQCNSLVTSGSKQDIIEFEKNELTLLNFDVALNCDFNSLMIENITIENQGEFDVIEDITLDIYYDADDDGELSAPDVLIANSIIPDDIGTGESITLSVGPFPVDPLESCKLIGFISACSCTPLVTTANNFKGTNAGIDEMGCSSDQFFLGCGADLSSLGFEYQWFGINGAPLDSLVDSTDPNTTLSFTHYNSNPLVLEYILITNFPNDLCSTIDTVVFTLDGIIVEQGEEIKICPSESRNLTGPLGFSNCEWSPTIGLQNPNDPQTSVLQPIGTINYTLTYHDNEGCIRYFEQSAKGVICTDLELTKTVNSSNAVLGDILTYTLTVTNEGPNGASGILVSDTLATQLTYMSSTPSGEYNPATGIWTIPVVMLPGDTQELIIEAQVIRGGPIFNVAEISYMNEGDLDSFQGNDNPYEDDQSGVCTAVPIDLFCRDTFAIGIPNDFTQYQWFRNGNAIAGFSTDSIFISESGTYHIEVDNGLCPYGNCCAFDANEEACANIGDWVWEDLNGNGLQDNNEIGIENVQIVLFDAVTSLAIDSTFSNASGDYSFVELPLANYFLSFDIATTNSSIVYIATNMDQGTDDSMDSDFDPNTFITNSFQFDPNNGNDDTRDAGFTPIADIGGFVWLDNNQNGIQDFAELPIGNVKVYLFNPNLNSIVDSTYTNADGEYLFSNIISNNLQVRFDLTTAIGYEAYGFTIQNNGDGTNDSEVNVNGVGDVFAFDARNGADLNHDAGILLVADLGGFVWEDTNGNGLQDNNEDGLNNTSITLFLESGLALQTIFTDTNGNYLFENVFSGNYYIIFDQTTITTSQNYIWTLFETGNGSNDSEANPSNGQTNIFAFDPANNDQLDHDAGLIPVANIGDFVWNDNNRNGIQDDAEIGIENVSVSLHNSIDQSIIETVFTNSDGAFYFNNIQSGNYYLSINSTTNSNNYIFLFTNQNAGNGLNDSKINPTTATGLTFTFDPLNGDELNQDAGLFVVANIGNYAWDDANQNGIQDQSENGIENISVILFEDDTDQLIASSFSNANGEYLFTNIPKGNYYAIFDPITNASGTSYSFTSPNMGDGTNDSNVNPIDGKTNVLNFNPTNGDDLNWDAGFFSIANISGYFWMDTNGDGLQDGNEFGSENVTVSLYDQITGQLLSTVFTNYLGVYSFDEIAAGNYYIIFDVSTSNELADFNFPFTHQGNGNGNNDSEVNANGQTPAFVFNPNNGNSSNHDAAQIPLANIGDFVWNDENGNGIIDTNESGLDNVTVSLYDVSTDNLIQSVNSNADGEYMLTNVLGGSYYLEFSAADPSLYFTIQNAGNGNNDSEANNDGQTSNFTFDPFNGNALDHDVGLYQGAVIGDFVWLDENLNGIQETNENGLENARVILFDANTNVSLDTVYTNSSGSYAFTEKIAGDYYLKFDPSTIANTGGTFNFSLADQSNEDSDSDPDLNGLTSIFALDTQNGDDTSWDAGLYQSASIGDFVWIDTDGDGIQDTNETGLANVTVRLYDANTNLIIHTITTDNSGHFNFENVTTGNYYLVFNPSTSVIGDNLEFSPMNIGDPEDDSNADSSGQSPNFFFDAALGDNQNMDAGLLPLPEISAVKSVASTSILVNDNLEVIYNLGVKNIGNITLTNITLQEDLANQMGDAFISVSNIQLISSSATSSPSFNNFFDGENNIDLFNGSTNDLLKAGQEIQLELIIEVDPTLVVWPLSNQSITIGEGLDLNEIPLTTLGGISVLANDHSDSGIDFEGTNPGELGDTGSSDDPTLLNCTPANLVISNAPIAVCNGSNVSMTVSSDIPNTVYEWRILGETTVLSTDQNFTYNSLNTFTTFEVTLIDNSGLCIYGLTTTHSVDLFSEPIANPIADYTLNVDCSPSDLNLTANTSASGSIISYNWFGPNGWTSSDENPIIVNAIEDYNGLFILTVTDNNGCETMASVDVSTIVNPVEEPVIAISGSLCEGENIVLSVANYNGPNLSYNWITPNGTSQNISGFNTNEITISNLDAATHIGNYELNLMVNGCELNAVPFFLDVFEMTAPSATQANICEGATLNLFANNPNANQYQWTGPNNFTSNEENPSIENITFAANGIYTLFYTHTSGCTLSETISVNNILQEPTMPGIITNTPVCENGNITLSIQEQYIGNDITYDWQNANGLSLGNTALINIEANNPTAISPYTVQVTVDGCAAPISLATAVDVFNNPMGNASNSGPVCSGSSVQLFSNTIAGASYEWRIQGESAIISTEQNPIITDIIAETTFELTVISNNCISDPTSSTTVELNPDPIVSVFNNYTANSNCSLTDLSFNIAPLIQSWTYQWTGPNNFSSTLAEPIISNATTVNNGIYTLLVTNENNCTQTQIIEVNGIVDPIEFPMITSTGIPCDGESLMLTVPMYAEYNVTYSWSTPNDVTVNITGLNTNSITINPIVAEGHEGAYTLSVITDDCEISSTPFELILNDSPNATPSVVGANCTGETMFLYANATNTNTYSWTGPNGFTSNEANPIIENTDIYNNGIYTLELGNSNACSSVVTIEINSISQTPVTPSIAAVSSVCVGGTFEVNILEQYAGNQVTYAWFNGVGAIVGTEPTLSMTANDENTISPFSVQVTVDGCIAQISETLSIEILENPIAIANNSGPVCSGSSVQLFANTIANAIYQWRIVGSNTIISLEQNPFISNLTETTIFELTIIVENCNSIPTSSTTVEINAEPIVSISSDYTANPNCSPTSLTLETSTSANENLTYQWTGPNNFTSNLSSPIISNVTTENNGLYILLVSNESNCTSTQSIEVTDIVNPLITPIINNIGVTCEGGSLELTVPVYAEPNVTYTWTTPNGVITNISELNTNSIVIDPLVEAMHEGAYILSVMTDYCEVTSLPFLLDVNQIPTASPSVEVANCTGGTLFLNANATGATAYSWTGPNNFSSNEMNPIIPNVDVYANGTYILTVNNGETCTTMSSVNVLNIVNTPLTPSLAAVSSVCEGGDFEINIFEEYTGNQITYNWINASGNTIGTEATLSMAANDPNAVSPFAVQVTVDGCSSNYSEQLFIDFNAIPQAIASNSGAICTGENAQLFANSIFGVAYQWRIAGNSQIISTEQNPIIENILESLTFELTIISENCNASSTDMTTIQLSENPSAHPFATYEGNLDCSPSNLYLTADASPAVVTYTWTGPNGFTSNAENPIIVNVTEEYNGTYTLFMENEYGCTATAVTNSITNITNTLPQPQIISNGTNCIGGAMALTVDVYAGSSVTYEWFTPENTNVDIIGFGTNQIVINPLNAANHQGAYTVNVTVDGCTLTSNTFILNLSDAIVADPLANLTGVCLGDPLQLQANATGTGQLTYIWEGPNGFSSSIENPTIPEVSTNYNGTYSLSVTSSQGCTQTFELMVDNILESGALPALIANSICIGDELTLATSTIGVLYEWIGPLGQSGVTLEIEGLTTNNSTTNLPIGHESYLAGDWQVRVTDANGCVSISNPVTISISAFPVALASNDGPKCEFEEIQLFASTVEDAQYRWFNGDPNASPPGALFSTEQNPILYNLTSGVHAYFLEVEKANCFSEFSMTLVDVKAVPQIEDMPENNTFCQGDDIFLSVINSSSLSSEVIYTWTGPNNFNYTGTSTSNEIISMELTNVDPSMEGVYQLILESDFACVSDPQSVNINISAIPTTPELLTNDAVVCEGELLELNTTLYTGTTVTYEWFFDNGDSLISLGSNNVPTFFMNNMSADNEGIYMVQTTVDGCFSSLSNTQDITVFGAEIIAETNNSTSAETPACEGSFVQLSLPFVPSATYQWYGPNSFTSNLPNPSIPSVNLNDAGEYYAVVEMETCNTVVTSPTTVYVSEAITAPTIFAESNFCEGSVIEINVTSPIENPTGGDITFDWYVSPINAFVGTTSEPSIEIENANAFMNGEYYVIMSIDGCEALSSEPIPIQVDEIPGNAAYAGEDIELCPYSSTALTAAMPNVGTGMWTSPSGASITNPTLSNTEVNDLSVGENVFVWTLSNGTCENYDSDTMVIAFAELPNDIAFAGLDMTVCGYSSVSLDAGVPIESQGMWTQPSSQSSLGVVILESTNPNTIVTGLVVGNIYEFYWTLSIPYCNEFSNDVVQVEVFEAPENSAFIPNDILHACGNESLTITAAEPTFGEGKWESLNGVNIIDPLESETFVDGLLFGENVFVWSLSNGTCINYSSDTLTVFQDGGKVTANFDAYVTARNEPLNEINLLENDDVNDVMNLEINLVGDPKSGEVQNVETGIFDYTPSHNFFGIDYFIYEICNTNCEATCDTAFVEIKVLGSEGDCWIPNVISPNDDGKNDALVIPCLEDYSDNEIDIYNRWGDKVFNEKPYLNDWSGTYKGDLLPVGTYFYVIRLNPDSDEMLQGFFTIIR